MGNTFNYEHLIPSYVLEQKSRDEGKLVRKAVIILELLRDQQQDAKHTLRKLAFNKH